MKIILLLSLILIIVIAIIINNRNTKSNNNVSQNMITQAPIPTPTLSLISNNDKERTIIIKILNKEKSTEFRIDTQFLTLLFDNLINLIQKLVKKLIFESNRKLNKAEINNLVPKFIATSVENLLRMILITIFEQEEIKDLDILKTKLLSIVQNNFITDFLLKNNDIESSTKIIESSTKILDNEINSNFKKMGIKSLNDVKIMIPNLLSNIIFDMSKGIITNIVVFDENGNIIQSDKLINIRNEFKNILNKYLPYKQVYFETSNNGSTNLPGVNLKLDQLKENEKGEPIISQEINFMDNLSNINKSFNIQQMNNDNMNLPFMTPNQLSYNNITTNLEQINDESTMTSFPFTSPMSSMQTMTPMPFMQTITPMSSMQTMTPMPSMQTITPMPSMQTMTPNQLSYNNITTNLEQINNESTMTTFPFTSPMSSMQTMTPMQSMQTMTPMQSMQTMTPMPIMTNNNSNLIQPIKTVDVETPTPIDISQLSPDSNYYQQISNLNINDRPSQFQNNRSQSPNNRPQFQNNRSRFQNNRSQSQNNRPQSQNNRPQSQNNRSQSKNNRPQSKNKSVGFNMLDNSIITLNSSVKNTNNKKPFGIVVC